MEGGGGCYQTKWLSNFNTHARAHTLVCCVLWSVCCVKAAIMRWSAATACLATQAGVVRRILHSISHWMRSARH